jgi:hypothetical protein
MAKAPNRLVRTPTTSQLQPPAFPVSPPSPTTGALGAGPLVPAPGALEAAGGTAAEPVAALLIAGGAAEEPVEGLGAAPDVDGAGALEVMVEGTGTSVPTGGVIVSTGAGPASVIMLGSGAGAQSAFDIFGVILVMYPGILVCATM